MQGPPVFPSSQKANGDNFGKWTAIEVRMEKHKLENVWLL